MLPTILVSAAKLRFQTLNLNILHPTSNPIEYLILHKHKTLLTLVNTMPALRIFSFLPFIFFSIHSYSLCPHSANTRHFCSLLTSAIRFSLLLFASHFCYSLLTSATAAQCALAAEAAQPLLG
jgi:hypothetical protein